MTSTLAAAKCAIDRGNVAIDLVYADNGRPKKVSIDPTGRSSGCQAAWTALARTALARWQQPALPDTVETVLMPLSTQFLRCTDQRGDVSETADIARASANVERPRKTKDVPPNYPQGAMKAHIEGTVFIDAMIDKSGCVSQGRVTHSIPGLDLAALYAVTQWVFEPAKRDGQPVPVYMTVTVRFTMR